MESTAKKEWKQQEQKAARLPQYIAAFAACMGAFGLGTGLAWTSPALPSLTNTSNPYFENDPMTVDEASWIGSFFTIGALIGAFVTGYLMATIGRKWTMISMVVPCTLGWVLLTMAGPMGLSDPWWFYIGRLLTGFGLGAFALAAPIYISETSETSLRGALGSCMQLLLTVGVLFVNGVGALMDADGWVILTGLCIIFPLLLGALMVFMPESPYYLVTKGKDAQARKSLQWLRGKNYDISDDMDEMKETFAHQQEMGSISFKDFFSKREYVLPLLIMLALMFFQQYSGINAVLFYLTDIFEKADTGMDAGLAATVVTLVQVLATGVAVLVVERFGRKLLLMTSDLLMCVSILALGVFFYLDENKIIVCDDLVGNSTSTSTTTEASSTVCVPQEGDFDEDLVKSLGWLPLTSLIIYIFAFSIGFGPLPWMMNGEFFSLESKSLASTLATAFNWICSFLVTKFEANIEEAIHTSGAYFMYASICALGVVFILFLVPETKGKTPEEMKKYFAKKD